VPVPYGAGCGGHRYPHAPEVQNARYSSEFASLLWSAADAEYAGETKSCADAVLHLAVPGRFLPYCAGFLLLAPARVQGGGFSTTEAVEWPAGPE